MPRKNKTSKAAKEREAAKKHQRTVNEDLENADISLANTHVDTPEAELEIPIDEHSNQVFIKDPEVDLCHPDNEFESIENHVLSIEREDIQRDEYSNQIIIEDPEVDHWDPDNEFESIQNHVLAIEREDIQRPEILKGRRIVDINFLMTKTLNLQYTHAKKCTFGELEIYGEQRNGLASTISLKCTFCEKLYKVSTAKDVSSINTSFVWGTLSSGSTYTQVKEFNNVLDVKIMSFNNFKKHELHLSGEWKDTLWQCMEKAGREEKEIAISKGQICEDGFPWITVHCDGGWSKRSYGHSYNALSGTAVIIGKETGKVIFIGVRNKYCSICAQATNCQKSPSTHICFKNFSGSSTSMESDILVEGFKKSLDMHGVRFLKIIGDGDSSVFAKIQKEVDYGETVEKLDCINHLIKNFGKKLYVVKTNSNIPIAGRKILTNFKIKKLQQFAIFCAHLCSNVDEFKTYISNSVFHIFDHHENCNEAYCNVKGHTGQSKKQILLESNIIFHLNNVLETILEKASKIIKCENNNKAENFMSVLAKFTRGKRLNLIQRGSFEMRAYLSALHYNEGPRWQCDAYKAITNGDVSSLLETYAEMKARSKIPKCGKRKRKRKHDQADKDYGPNAAQGTLSEKDVLSEYNRILLSLQVKQTYGASPTKRSEHVGYKRL